MEEGRLRDRKDERDGKQRHPVIIGPSHKLETARLGKEDAEYEAESQEEGVEAWSG